MKNTKIMKISGLVLTTIALIAALFAFGLTAAASDAEVACTEHTDAGYVEIDLENKNAEWRDDLIYEGSYTGYTANFGGDMVNEDNNSIESEVLLLSPGETYVLEFDWGINQYFTQYGRFTMKFYHNGELKISRDYTEEPCEIVETVAYEFSASEGGDKFKWEFDKTNSSYWADDGRTAYLGGLLVTTTGNVCTDILTCVNCGEQFLAANQISHDPEVELNEDGMCPNLNCHTYEQMLLVTADNYESLGLNEDHVGYYAITEIGHLYLIADMSNDGLGPINAVLLTDIDLSEHRSLEIGNAKTEFCGIFDGNGKTITIDMVTTTSNSGLFKYIKNSTIKNLTVDGTLNTKFTVSGGIVGVARGDNTIVNCISKVNTVSTVDGDGTHAGIVGVNDGSLNLLNSAFVGSIIGENAYNNGGLVGWTVEERQTIVENCYVYATISTDTEGCDIIGRNYYQYTVINTYYINNAHGYRDNGQAIGAEREKFESGEIAYLLGDAWGQNIGVDDYPVFATDSNKVYYGYVSCASGAVPVYSNNSGATATKPEHVWIALEGVCAVCLETVIPEYEFPTKPYLTEEELNLPIDEIRTHFNRTLEVKYENGKYMIEDIGASFAEIFFGDALTYENGYWVVEMDEETYNAGNIRVNFSGKDQIWSILYNDGEPEGALQISINYNEYVIKVYMHSPWVEVAYPVFDRFCKDYYKNGELDTHSQTYYFANRDFFEVVYNPDKTVNHIKVHSVEEPDEDKYYCYLSPDGEWYTNPTFDAEFLTGAPLGYENTEIGYFVQLTPCIINCTHESLAAADCTNAAYCLICSVIPEGSEPLGHDMVIDKAVDPTCTEYGYTEGTHCSRCDDMTVAQEPIDPTNHDWDEGEVTTEPTCSAMGETTYTCKNDASHTKTETDVAIDANAHAWDEGEVIVAPTCVEMGKTVYTCTHDDRHIKIETDVAIDENAHDWGEGEVTTEPTCTEKGVMTYTCTLSGEHTYTVEVDALGHTEEAIAAKAATCIEKGLTAGVKCSVCDEILTAQTEIAAAGHKYDNACDVFCNVCNTERVTDDHKDEDKNLLCDECEAELERKGLPDGAVVAISIGATLAAELGGISIFWFVIKKKKLSDLIGVFKK